MGATPLAPEGGVPTRCRELRVRPSRAWPETPAEARTRYAGLVGGRHYVGVRSVDDPGRDEGGGAAWVLRRLGFEVRNVRDSQAARAGQQAAHPDRPDPRRQKDNAGLLVPALRPTAANLLTVASWRGQGLVRSHEGPTKHEITQQTR